MSTNQLLFPVGYWDGPAPRHEITALVKGSNYLVSGSATGELVYWKPDKPPSVPGSGSGHGKGSGNAKPEAVQQEGQPPGPVFRPHALLMREASQRCTALVRCQLGSTEIFIAATSEGYLTTWAATGGRCFHSRAVLPFAPTQIVPFEWDDTAYLACAGDTTDVHIIQLSTLQLVKVLRHRQTVVSIVLTPPAYAPTPFLFVLTSEGILYLWDLTLLIPGASMTGGLSVPSLNLDGSSSSSSSSSSAAASQQQQQQQSSLARSATVLPGNGGSGSTATTAAVGPPARSTSPPPRGTTVPPSSSSSSLASGSGSSAASSKDAMYERQQALTVPDALGEKVSSSPKHAALSKREVLAQNRIAREPSHSIHFPHLPSPPVSLAISPDAACFIVCLQRHWTVCSMRTFRPVCPMMENPLFAAAGGSSPGIADLFSPVPSPVAVHAPDRSAPLPLHLLPLHQHRHALPHTGSRGKHVGTAGARYAGSGAGMLPPKSQQQPPEQDPYYAAMLRARGFSGCSFVDAVSASDSSGSTAAAPARSKRVALWTGAGQVFCYQVSLVRPSPSSSSLSLSSSVASSIASSAAAAAPSERKEGEGAGTPVSASAASTEPSPSSSLSPVPRSASSSALQHGSGSGRSGSPAPRSRNLPRPVPLCFFSVEAALRQKELERHRKEKEEAEAKRKRDREEGEAEEEKEKKEEKHEGTGFGGAGGAEPYADWDGTERLPLACVHTEGDLILIGSAAGALAAYKLPAGPVPAEAEGPLSLEPYAVTSVTDAFPLEHNPVTRENPCTASVLLRETTYILLARGYKSGLVSVVRILAGPTQRIELQGHTEDITSLVAIPSGESVTRRAMLISASLDRTIRLWNLESNKYIGMLHCTSGITSLHWHPPRLAAPTNAGPDTPLVPVGEAGDLLFAMCEDRAIRVFSLQAMALVQTLPGHDSPIHAIYRDDWCVMSDHVVVQTKLGTVYVWVLSSGDLERCMEAGSQVAERFLYARGLHTSHLGRPPTAQPRKKARATLRSRIGLRRNKESEAAAAAPTGPHQAHGTAIRVVPLTGATHLHLLLYVVNINRLLEELHTRFTMLSKTFQRLVGAERRDELLSPTAMQLAALEKESQERRQALAELHMLQGMLSLLFDWGADHSMDRMLTEKLGLLAPIPLPSFGVLSDNGRAFTVLLPSQSIEFKPLGRWEFDPQFSARHALSLSTVCMSLLSSGDPAKQIHYSRIVSHYNVILPDALSTYVEPDIQVLAAFALNASEEVHTVARLLLQGVIERSSDAHRREIVRRWSAFYNYQLPNQDHDEKGKSQHHHPDAPEGDGLLPGTGPVSDQELMTALVLCLIAVHDASKRKQRLREERQEVLERRMEAKNGDGHSGDGSSPQHAAAAPPPPKEEPKSQLQSSLSEDDINLSSAEAVAHAAALEHEDPTGRRAALESVEQHLREARSRSKAEDTKGVALSVSTSASSSASSSSAAPSGIAVSLAAAAAAASASSSAASTLPRSTPGGLSPHEIVYGAQEDDEEYCSEVEIYAQYVVNTLLRALARAEGPDAVRCALACELLGKGFSLWKNYIVDLVGVIRRIHQLSLLKQSAIFSAAHRALMEAGRIVPKYFVLCMGKEAINSKASANARSGALIAIVALVRRFPEALAYVLPDTVQIITRCLDPSDPALRKSLLQSATAALHSLVQKYPMVSFHQETQRFAVGTGVSLKSVIIIYDLRTATKFRILEGHAAPLTAVSFSPNGKTLVSYSADEEEPTVRVWNTGAQSWLSGLIGIQGKLIRMFKVPKTKVRSLSKKLQTCKIVWTPKNGVTLIREDGTHCNFQL